MGVTYEIRPLLDGGWSPAGDLYEDAEEVLIDAAPDGESVWLLRNNFNASVTVMGVAKLAGFEPVALIRGSYLSYFGRHYQEEEAHG